MMCAHADPRQWNAAGIPIRQGNRIEWSRTTAQDAAGNTLMVWSDTRSGDRDIYAQLFSPEGVALWTAGGVNVCNRAPRHQSSPAACAVADGWIVAWIDARTDSFGDVWAQKLNNAGARVWTGNNGTGMPVDANPSMVNELSVRIVPDGTGGALIAWEDTRHGDTGDIYAQRINAGGEVPWNSALAVTNVSGAQNQLVAAADGNGNMLLAWHDERHPENHDIYAAKVTPDSELPWGGQNGMAVCTASNNQIIPTICFDGASGCYLAWTDYRSTSNDLYVQSISGAGVIQWVANGVVLCNAVYDQESVRLALSTNAGTPDGCIAVWEDQRVNGECREVYAQKVSPQGGMLWQANGMLVCGNAGQDSLGASGDTREDVRLISDRSGGLVCAWEDTRNVDNDWSNSDIYASRVLSGGTFGWGSGCGVLIADGAQRQESAALAFAGDGVIVMFDDWSAGSQTLKVQKASLSDGSPLLTPTGVTALAGLDGDADEQCALELSPGRTAVVWVDARAASSGYQLFYQILNGDGECEQDVNGIPLITDNSGGSLIRQENPNLCADGNGGFFVVFEDLRSAVKQIRLSHVNVEGEVDNSPAGSIVYYDATAFSDQIRPYCASDGNGGCYVAWSNYDRSFYLDAYVMRMNADGSPAWQQPVRLTNSQDDDMVYGLVSGPNGCCTVVWQSGAYQGFDISAASVCRDGLVAFNGTVCNAANEQSTPAIIADGQGGAYFAWEDKRNASPQNGYGRDIYAQHLGSSGEELWNHNGVLVSGDTLSQYKPALALSGDGSLFVVWQDFRNNNHLDLYGQKLSPAGALLWPEHGMVICAAAGDQSGQALLRDSGNGLFVVWQDNRSYWPQAYATHLDADGAPTGDAYWVAGSGGALTEPVPQWQWHPAAVSDGAGGLVAVWTDQRSSGIEPWRDLYAQHIADANAAKDRPDGMPAAYALAQNFPNPFNPVTQISFDLPHAGQTTLKVYDLLGREVATLLSRSLTAGNHQVNFNGGSLASGLYFYRIESGSFSATKKMVLLK
jgi:hypothetical protein